MSDFQYTEYKKTLPLINKNDINNKENYNSDDIINLPNNFYINSRMMLNMVFPNKKKGFDGYKSITIKTIENLKKYSTKYFELFKKLKKKGTCFIYSNFKEYGGIYTIQLILDFYGYNNFKNNGVGKNTYAIWSGDESNEYKNIVKETFNNFNNFKGENIKIIIGSPSIKEGVSLYGVRNVHIIDPYWNWSRLDQIIGRAVRFCSHKDLEKEKRNVKIYFYITCGPNDEKTIDDYILKIANNKQKLTKEFENIIKHSAIDYYLK